MGIKEELQKIIQGDVEDSNEVLSSHSHDASLFEVRPELVVYPKNTEDVSKLVSYVSEKKDTDSSISLTPRAAGTCMAGGSLNTSVILDSTRYMNILGEAREVSSYRYLPHFPGAEPVQISGEIQTGPGTYYRDFEKKTLAKDLLLPCFTASKSINALGGMIGNNSGGELSLKYGKTEDYVKDVEIVFADGSVETVGEMSLVEAQKRSEKADFVGSIYKKILNLIQKNKELIQSKRPQVSKNSAGYNIWNVMRGDTFDLSQLIVGAQGTLGIATKATMRLVKKKKHESLLVVFLSDLSHLIEVENHALNAHPETIEAYDDKTIKLALKFWTGFIKKRGFWGALKLGLQFIPEVGMLFGGMPKLVLLIESAGEHQDEVLSRLKLLQKRLTGIPGVRTRLVKRKQSAEKYWSIRHDSFALLREHYQGKRTAPFVDDVIVPAEKLPEFVPAVRDILEKHNLTYNIHGHAGNGNFHIIPLIDTDARLSEEMILSVSEEVYSLVLKLGGSITAEHNDGIIRTPYLKDMFGEEMEKIFKEVKDIFDPKGIFNPGKKVGLTKKDIGRFLAKG